MKFTHWFETTETPDNLAQHWQNNIPDDTPEYRNEVAINQFLNAMADPVMNGQAIALDLLRGTIHQSRYEKPIQNNLLSVVDPKLGYAYGVVSNKVRPTFGFNPVGKEAGNLFIYIPPLAFDDDDKVMLLSIIRHELGHAMDFLNPEFANTELSGRYVQVNGKYVFDVTKYAQNIHEARRLSEQLQFLLRRMNGNVDKVMQLLRGKRLTPDRIANIEKQKVAANQSARDNARRQELNLLNNPVSPFSFPTGLLPVAQAFLLAIKNKNESFFNTANLLGTKPALVQTQQFDLQAASCVTQIMNLFHFKNFVKKA